MKDPVETEVLIEFPEQTGLVPAGIEDKLEQARAYSEEAMKVAMSSIHAMARNISSSLHDFGEDIAPDEISVEFGLKLELEGSVGGGIIPWISKVTTGGQFTVNVKWNLDQSNKVKARVTSKS